MFSAGLRPGGGEVLEVNRTPSEQWGRVHVATRYQPAAGEAVGGDWLDVFTLPDGRVCVTVGDVAGHGIGSAATMSRLLYALRALASTGAAPAEVVSRLNQAMHFSGLASADIEIATVVYAQFDPGTGVLCHCSAGHPPLIGLAPGPGVRVRHLLSAGGPPIGVIPDAEYAEHCEVIARGSLLIGYTDGLVERRGLSLDDGLDELVTGLRGRLADLESPAGGLDVEQVADAVLAAAPPGRREDDTAVIVVALLGHVEPCPPTAVSARGDALRGDPVQGDAVQVG
jgi:serine phosphatase RsbU (regulator of sigma subunit)